MRNHYFLQVGCLHLWVFLSTVRPQNCGFVLYMALPTHNIFVYNEVGLQRGAKAPLIFQRCSGLHMLSCMP